MLDDFIIDDLKDFDEIDTTETNSDTYFEESTDDSSNEMNEDSGISELFQDDLFVQDTTSDDWSDQDILTENGSADNLTQLDTLKEEQDNNQNKLFKRFEPSFLGYGRCSYCGCGSFVGIGDMCDNCGHSFEAHSRYKK